MPVFARIMRRYCVVMGSLSGSFCKPGAAGKIYGDMRDRDRKLRAAKQELQVDPVLSTSKKRVFSQLKAAYADLKLTWGGAAGYDAWFAVDLNNAKLNAVANYHDLLPAFEQLLAFNKGGLEKVLRGRGALGQITQRTTPAMPA
jgi:hypothetical protein